MAGIYIHIPFCKQACSYCDFYFVTRESLRGDFVDALISEIRSWRDSPESEQEMETVYLGGGTPSRLHPDELERIFDELRDTFRITGREFTMELNPDDLNKSYLGHLKAIGVGRASMGVQTFHERRLRFMNRSHTSHQAQHALEMLHEEGFESFNVDLIYGSPGETTDELLKDLDRLLRFEPPHLSAYSLTIEPRTRLGKLHELGRLEPADEDEVGSQMRVIRERLRQEGIHRYEVSNYSKPGHEALHNRHYWNHTPYLGLGPSAHSFWPSESGGRRWRNRPDLKHYLERWLGEAGRDERGSARMDTPAGRSAPGLYNRYDKSDGDRLARRPEEVEDIELLSHFELAEERIMMGLRTRDGVEFAELEKRYGYNLKECQLDWLEEMRREGFFSEDPSRIVLSDDGLAIADRLIVDLLHRHTSGRPLAGRQ